MHTKEEKRKQLASSVVGPSSRPVFRLQTGNQYDNSKALRSILIYIYILFSQKKRNSFGLYVT